LIETRKGKCKCLKNISIFSHGDSGTIYTQGDLEGASINPDTVRRINNGNAFTADDQTVRNILTRLKNALCPDGRIVFHACHAGSYESGLQLERELSRFFGFPIDLPEKFVRPGLGGGIETGDE
jgi:hypothetical protein